MRKLCTRPCVTAVTRHQCSIWPWKRVCILSSLDSTQSFRSSTDGRLPVSSTSSFIDDTINIPSDSMRTIIFHPLFILPHITSLYTYTRAISLMVMLINAISISRRNVDGEQFPSSTRYFHLITMTMFAILVVLLAVVSSALFWYLMTSWLGIQLLFNDEEAVPFRWFPASWR